MHFSTIQHFVVHFLGPSNQSDIVDDEGNVADEGADEATDMDTDDESTATDGPSQSEPAAEKEVSLGMYVVVTYEGEMFPGQVKIVNPNGTAEISTLVKCTKGLGWKWPAQIDQIVYQREDIVLTDIKAIQINNRGFLQFPAMDEIWGK